MFDTILIPTDGSADARKGARYGVGLAAALGATVHALYVIHDTTNPWMSESIDDQLDRARGYGDDVTGEVAELATDVGVTCVTATSVGSRVHVAINEYTEEEGVDLIVIGSGYRGTLGDLLGSTADRVLRTATVPVMVIRRTESA